MFECVIELLPSDAYLEEAARGVKRQIATFNDSLCVIHFVLQNLLYLCAWT